MSSVNVVVDSPKHHYKDDSYGFDTEVADVYYVGCNMLLGQKIVRSSMQFSSWFFFYAKLGSKLVNE